MNCILCCWIDIPSCILSFLGVSSLRVKIQVCTLWMMKQQDSVLYEFDAWVSLFRGPYWQEFQLHFSFPLRCQIIRTIEQEHLKSFFLVLRQDVSNCNIFLFFSFYFFPKSFLCRTLQDPNFKIMAWHWASSRGVWQDAHFCKFGSIMPHQISGWSNHLHCFLFDKSMSRKSRCAKWRTYCNDSKFQASLDLFIRRIKAERYVHWRTPSGKATWKP